MVPIVNNSKKLLLFFFLLIGLLTVSYCIQWNLITRSKIFGVQVINFAHFFNGIYTLIMIIFFFLFMEKLKNHLGYIFLISSFLKLVFFAVFVKFLNLEMDKTLFLYFFLPYAISLVLEVYFLSKTLSDLKY